MTWKTLLTVVICFGLLLMLAQPAMARDPDKRDVHGVSPQHHKYIFSVLGGAALGAGMGFLLPGHKTPLKLMMIGSGGASTWFLYTHPRELGSFHSMGLIGSNAVLGSGMGWTVCNCRDGGWGGLLIGGGATGLWEALKNDSAARNAFRH